MALGAVYLAATISGRQASLFLVGAFAGIVLYHAAFGFTPSWPAFIAGAVLGSAHLPWWESQPALKAVSLVTTFGVAGGLAISVAAFAAIAALTVWIERRRHGSLEPASRDRSWWRGPWPIIAGAVGLAIVNVLTLALAGRPWGITGAFSLWGAKALAALGVPVESWRYV